jgi:hypothetical protein
MEQKRVVYVNNNNDFENIIYGGGDDEQSGAKQSGAKHSDVVQSDVEQSDANDVEVVKLSNVEDTVDEVEVVIDGDLNVDSKHDSNVDSKRDLECDSKHDSNVDSNVDSKRDLEGDSKRDLEGDLEDGYASEASSDDVSSLSTTALLTVDPLYYRLTKFLQADGCDGPLNVAEILTKININIEKLNDLMRTYVKDK